MDRDQLIYTTAAILLGTFLLGWISCWVVMRLTRPSKSDMTALEAMAQQLHDAEIERDLAVDRLEQREAALNRRLVVTENELETALNTMRERGAELEELRDYMAQRQRPAEQ